MTTHLIYGTLILTLISLSLFTIDMQEDAINEEKRKHEVTKVELYELKQTIAEGLCLPRLEGFAK